MMPFFDARCGIGQFSRTGVRTGVDDLLRLMDRLSISRALVYHALAREASPLEGNDLLLTVLAGHPRLVPCWVLLPPGTGEIPDYEGYLAQAVSRGVRAFAVYPATFGVCLSHWVRSGAFAPLEKMAAPVFVCPNAGQSEPWDRGDWDGMRVLLERHPNLPVVFTEHRMRYHIRVLLFFLREFPNLFFDISSCWNYRSLEGLAEAVGAHRLVAGTDIPRADPGHCLGMVLLSDLPDEAREAVAFRTLERLIEGVSCG